jgi:hypothetical protein
MEARISVTTSDGVVYEGTAVLSSAQQPLRRSPSVSAKVAGAEVSRKPDDLQFTLPVRPFMKKFGAGKSGPRRLVLLVAHLAQGKVGASIEISTVQKLWGKMSALMGGSYNSAYVSRARDDGWVDSPKFGTVTLLSGWKGAL